LNSIRWTSRSHPIAHQTAKVNLRWFSNDFSHDHDQQCANANQYIRKWIESDPTLKMRSRCNRFWGQLSRQCFRAFRFCTGAAGAVHGFSQTGK
jgi:hypothetical protein